DGFHRREIAGTGNGKARLDHVHPQTLQGLGDAEFFLLGHRGAGALFAVTQGGIEDDQFVFGGAHGNLRSGQPAYYGAEWAHSQQGRHYSPRPHALPRVSPDTKKPRPAGLSDTLRVTRNGIRQPAARRYRLPPRRLWPAGRTGW